MSVIVWYVTGDLNSDLTTRTPSNSLYIRTDRTSISSPISFYTPFSSMASLEVLRSSTLKNQVLTHYVIIFIFLIHYSQLTMLKPLQQEFTPLSLQLRQSRKVVKCLREWLKGLLQQAALLICRSAENEGQMKCGY